ncbi:right-handed parallel beta-helix repeat-containing protein [Coraliomargarita sp. SDUM461003]|uniref:Right-handed parallel beta-helix repeat-containing protein n=2 Tax=Thalassobacterium maritimum TaxID=3041265 RepID=A0ABU1ATN6_9BACT|nr:right-handed parallel beta-helix repeat-containing protein [Coraliomargarita sp. SDUM461003]MDQ8207526.1 right-handed parallel beta-helix repeat-containing protein [Coraliomargarita sp. SDUM461003]
MSTLLLVVGAPMQDGAEVEVDFYVSNVGSDQWTGRLEAPNADGTDGPFATLKRARNAVRALKPREMSGDIVVMIRGGWYPLRETLVFSLEDSGDADTRITYAAYPGEEPVFSSGKVVEDWKKVTATIPGLPEAAVGNVWVAEVSGSFRTLYDAEGMLPRAQSEGFIPRVGGSRNRVVLPAADFKNWSNYKDAEIVVRPHHAWIMNILPVVSIDEATQSVHTSVDATYLMNPLKFLHSEKIESCWVENVFEALDQPGEWVLDTQAGKVYVWRRNDSAVVAPQLTELIRVEGQVDKDGPQDLPVRNLRFVGLTFKHGERYQIDENDAGLQHDWDFLDKANALVRFRGTEDCAIEQCHFLHSGSGAIRVDLHGQNNRIVGNHIEQMGGSGVLLAGYGPGTKDVNRNNLVFNNHIHHVGQIYWHSPGIFIWQSGENRVAHNLVHHTPYTAIILSGCMTEFFGKGGRELTRTIRWHEIGGSSKSFKQASLEDVRPFLHSHDNQIERNEIHNAMERMGDGNAIYIRGAGAGNVIRENYIHHLVTPMIMQCAIRTDGGQMDTLITGNLIYKCTSQGIMLKLNNRCENNIIADVIAPPRGYYLSVREGPMTGASIQRNIFYSSGEDTVFIHELGPKNEGASEDRRGRELARSKDAETDYNIYYNVADPSHGRDFLKQQQQDGVDTHSLAVDPLFVNPAEGDFRLRPDSPAIPMGIPSFDTSKVGLIPN